MSQPKTFASLSSSLLARKGHAKPAMRPQAFHISGDLAQSTYGQDDDLGWNDMGFDAEPSQPSAPGARVVPLTPPDGSADVAMNGGAAAQGAVSPVVAQQAKLREEFGAPEPVLTPPTAAVRRAAGSKPKAAFTLRLDPERHLRLRLVCALQHRSAQNVVTQALDEFLVRQPGIEAADARRTR